MEKRSGGPASTSRRRPGTFTEPSYGEFLGTTAVVSAAEEFSVRRQKEQRPRGRNRGQAQPRRNIAAIESRRPALRKDSRKGQADARRLRGAGRGRSPSRRTGIPAAQ